MPLDQSFAGRSYPPSPPYEVGREKIREFADAVGEASPVHRDPEAARAAGYKDVIAPPTFAVVLSLKVNDLLIDDPDLGLDYGRVVHGDQSFVHHRPITAGDRLRVELHVDGVTTRMGNDMLALRAEITTEDGEPVTTAKSTLVVRGENA
ncbi:MaoC family dehydratase N-terminal domain-containing protein [Saccharothrix sp. NRRL B-16314]|uniref:MaoC family dehydratase N-terminal domain-containing protein n=1 Tax=Saccharothrix sp. NRRL B-16314 TaxID=1463825 RepID=UPI000525B7CA|nr:MaoC family dehydratase N-terminal domain-containing protein [Saccharothrix sp. NRRL B-16314]